MDANRTNHGITNYARKLVHHKALQLVGTAGYTEQDVKDIKQELITHLLERLPQFDPAKATYNTFVACLVNRKISNLIRYRHAARRDYKREACSLNEEISVGEDELVQRVSTISHDENDIRLGKRDRTTEDQAYLEIDVKEVLEKLPAPLRRAAELLQHHSIAKVASALGVSRETFQDNHLVQLRQIFTAAGLGNYLI